MALIELMMLDTPKTDYGKKKNKLTDEDYKACDEANEALTKAYLEKHKASNKGVEMNMNEFLNK